MFKLFIYGIKYQFLLIFFIKFLCHNRKYQNLIGLIILCNLLNLMIYLFMISNIYLKY